MHTAYDVDGERLLCGAGGATYAVAMFVLIVPVTVGGESNPSVQHPILITDH